ncbi:MAG: hypothetical protein HS111_04670 [Kofleriaceae bacterium]|nr:hypothetical protein [Kofleriaceae bacterium]
MDNKTRMDASALDDDLEARIGQRGEARVGVRVDHVVVDEVGAGQSLLERRVVGEPDQRLSVVSMFDGGVVTLPDGYAGRETDLRGRGSGAVATREGGAGRGVRVVADGGGDDGGRRSALASGRGLGASRGLEVLEEQLLVGARSSRSTATARSSSAMFMRTR